MGNTPMQHRVMTGCYSSRLCSSGWTPRSSGKALCNRTCQRRVGFPNPNQDMCGVLLLIIKLAAIALPVLINGPTFSDENYVSLNISCVAIVLSR